MSSQPTTIAAPRARILRLGFGLLLVLGLASSLGLWLQINRTLDLPDPEVVYEIPHGAGLSAVAADLQQRGWIPSAFWLRLYGRITSAQGHIKAGEYQLSREMTLQSLLQSLRDGKVIQHRFTIIEGWTFDRVLQALAEEKNLLHTLKALSKAEIMDRLSIAGERPEGYLFPDTYQYVKGTSDYSVLKQSVERMNSILQQEWLGRRQDLPYQSPYDVLIMASIIEKETALDADRTKIAAVFLRRLGLGMRLQSDPTVIYGMGNDYNGNLTRRDLQKSTLYNTYVNNGLPPTPICNPGLASIRAALYPADTSSLYFVSRGDGSSEFSDTLEEHNRAVRQYQIPDNR